MKRNQYLSSAWMNMSSESKKLHICQTLIYRKLTETIYLETHWKYIFEGYWKYISKYNGNTNGVTVEILVVRGSGLKGTNTK